MSVDVEQRIRDRAYAIWLEQGCPDGRDGDHWLQAERDIAAASETGVSETVVVPAAKTPRRSAKSVKTPPVDTPVVGAAKGPSKAPRASKAKAAAVAEGVPAAAEASTESSKPRKPRVRKVVPA